MKHVSSGTVCFLVSAIFSLINSRFLFLITISYYNYEKKGAWIAKGGWFRPIWLTKVKIRENRSCSHLRLWPSWVSMLRPHSYGIYNHRSPKLLLVVCLSDPCHVSMHLQLSKHSAALWLWSMTARVRIHSVAAIQQPCIVKFYSKLKTDAQLSPVLIQDGFVIKKQSVFFATVPWHIFH
jgi:hypothetical protein